jgi:hypothetical protein
MHRELAGAMAREWETGRVLMFELVTRATVPTSLKIITHPVAVLMRKAVF